MDAILAGKLLDQCGQFYWSPQGFRIPSNSKRSPRANGAQRSSTSSLSFAFERQVASRITLAPLLGRPTNAGAERCGSAEPALAGCQARLGPMGPTVEVCFTHNM
jgi:hypothetical protein